MKRELILAKRDRKALERLRWRSDSYSIDGVRWIGVGFGGLLFAALPRRRAGGFCCF